MQTAHEDGDLQTTDRDGDLLSDRLRQITDKDGNLILTRPDENKDLMNSDDLQGNRWKRIPNGKEDLLSDRKENT